WRGSDDPFLVHVGDQGGLPGWAGHGPRAEPRITLSGCDLGRSGVAGAVGRVALQAGLDNRAAVGGSHPGAADDVVDCSGGPREAVDRVGRVVRMMEVQRPGHLAALRWSDRLEAHAAGLRVAEVGIVSAGHEGEDPEDLARRLRAGEVDLARLGLDVWIL